MTVDVARCALGRGFPRAVVSRLISVCPVGENPGARRPSVAGVRWRIHRGLTPRVVGIPRRIGRMAHGGVRVVT
ncbi:MAG TPA: hypothetical protein VGO16_02260 [Pseudonocardiaceae bacterium]|nr:hypothetical protein [Pseudonocardiaceae bacterium]